MHPLLHWCPPTSGSICVSACLAYYWHKSSFINTIPKVATLRMRSSSWPSAKMPDLHDYRDSQHSSSGSKSSSVVSPLFSLTSPMVSKVALSSTGSSMSITFLSCVDYPDLPSVSWIVIELATLIVCFMFVWPASALFSLRMILTSKVFFEGLDGSCWPLD